MKPVSRTSATPVNSHPVDPNWQNDPTITVQGAFTGGGSSAGAQSDHTDHYEFQNYTSLSQGKHFIKFGVRVRAIHEVNTSNAGFNGTFTFSDLHHRLRAAC